MPRLLSGSTLRRGGSGEFLDLKGAQPQLPATDTTLTGFTLVTNNLLQTSYKSSLGFVEFTSASMYSALPEGTIRILNTGTGTVSTSTVTGLLVVNGDIGVGGTIYAWKDIHVNGITIGTGYEYGTNNIAITGTAEPLVDNFETGQQSIAIGYDALKGLPFSYKNLAIGRNALSTGINISNNIAIGDSSLKMVGVFTSTGTLNDSNVAIGVNAGVSLVNGQQNVFVGHDAANLLTTGSYNIIIGPLTGQYLYTGSGIISIGGDNIVDGKDDQVNIGSVFYYDGSGYAYVSAETTVGLGTTAQVTSPGPFTSTSTVTGGLVVVGGIFGWDNLILVNTMEIWGTGTSTIAGPLVPDGVLSTLGETGNPFNVVHFKDTYITGELLVNGNENAELSPAGANVIIKPSVGGSVEIWPNDTGNMDNVVIGENAPTAATFNAVSVISTTSATSTITGAVQVQGGVGITGDVYAQSGNPAENFLLYTPQVYITAGTPPATPRVGDFWIDSTIPAYLQYIKDGTSTFWLQVGAV